MVWEKRFFISILKYKNYIYIVEMKMKNIDWLHVLTVNVMCLTNNAYSKVSFLQGLKCVSLSVMI